MNFYWGMVSISLAWILMLLWKVENLTIAEWRAVPPGHVQAGPQFHISEIIQKHYMVRYSDSAWVDVNLWLHQRGQEKMVKWSPIEMVRVQVGVGGVSLEI